MGGVTGQDHAPPGPSVGARLHAGSTPTGDLDRIRRKMDFLITSGVPERDAQMAMLAASRLTVGSVLEEQADTGAGERTDLPADVPRHVEANQSQQHRPHPVRA